MCSGNVTLLIEQLSRVTNESDVYGTSATIHSPHESMNLQPGMAQAERSAAASS